MLRIRIESYVYSLQKLVLWVVLLSWFPFCFFPELLGHQRPLMVTARRPFWSAKKTAHRFKPNSSIKPGHIEFWTSAEWIWGEEGNIKAYNPGPQDLCSGWLLAWGHLHLCGSLITQSFQSHQPPFTHKHQRDTVLTHTCSQSTLHRHTHTHTRFKSWVFFGGGSLCIRWSHWLDACWEIPSSPLFLYYNLPPPSFLPSILPVLFSSPGPSSLYPIYPNTSPPPPTIFVFFSGFLALPHHTYPAVLFLPFLLPTTYFSGLILLSLHFSPLPPSLQHPN